MLLTFVGQVSFVAAIPCHMETPTSNQTSVMDHSAHMMGEQNSDSEINSMKDCCSKAGSCSMSGCISLALPNATNDSETNTSSESILSPIDLVLNQALTFLYRPPILS